MKLNRSDIVPRLAKRSDLLAIDDIELVISVILEALKDHLVQGDRIELRGFGSFYTTYRKPRLGRNPRTGMQVKVPGKWVPHFKAGKELRSEVNARFDAKTLAARRDRHQTTQSQIGMDTVSSRSVIHGSRIPGNAAM